MRKIIALLVILMGLLSGCGLFSRGTVYFLNNDPDTDAAWQQIAQQFEKEQNIKVKIVSVDPQSYGQKLAEELESGAGPAIVLCENARDAELWQDYLLDLRGTQLLSQCVNWDYNLMAQDDAILAVGYTKEYTGMIVNKALLKIAGYTAEQIVDFASLKAVAEDITARKETLRFSAFTSGSEESSLQMINNVLYYSTRTEIAQIRPNKLKQEQLDNLRNILQLYAANGTASGTDVAMRSNREALAEFAEGRAAFCIGSSEMFDDLIRSGMRAEDLTMIPLYCGAAGEQENGLSVGTDRYWAVNSQASKNEVQLALEFLNWMASSEEGLSMLQEQYGDVPFRNAWKSENGFCQDAEKMEREGKPAFSWVYDRINCDKEWLEDLVFAMRVYYSEPGQTSWDQIVDVIKGN